MDESILTSIKKLLGIEEDYDHFDKDLVIHINSVFTVLNQIGLGTSNFIIKGSDETWGDFLGADTKNLELVKTYVYMRVKMMFDPPSSSSVMDSTKQIIDELEWRISVTVDPATTFASS